MLLYISTIILVLNYIPNKYLDLVNEAKNSPLQQFSIKEKDILTPNNYSINNFKFQINATIIKKGERDIFSYAFHETEKVIAIILNQKSNISSLDIQKDTILSATENSHLVKLDEKIAEHKNVAIIKYSDVDPFSIFSNFHFSNFDEILTNDNNNIFANIYKPVRSYYGNDIYEQYGYNLKCPSFQNTTYFCRKFLNYNFPPIIKGTNISFLEPITGSQNMTKNFETNIGGVFGLFAGIDINLKNSNELIFKLFHASEAETHIKIILPPGDYTNENIVLESRTINIFNYSFKIFDIEYSVIVNGTSSISIKNITYKSNKKLEFFQRAGFKSQKEFKIDNSTVSQKSSSDSMKYEIFKTDVNDYDLNFYGEKLELNISIKTGLEVILNSKFKRNETNFTINCDVEYNRKIKTKHNSTICPSPYLLGKSIENGFYNLEIKKPFVYQNSQIIPARTLHGHFWSRNNDNSWCLGGYLYANDENQKNGTLNSAVLIVEYAKYLTEYKEKPLIYYNIIVNIYNDQYEHKKTLTLPAFQFSGESSSDVTHPTQLKINSYLDDFSNAKLLKFSCFDSSNVEFNDAEYHKINEGFNNEITLTSKKGTSIKLQIYIGLCTNCSFEVQTNIETPSYYASVQPNLSYGDAIGLITHKNGSPFDVLMTKIFDEYSNEKNKNCIYNIKKVYNIELINLNISEEFDFVEISMLKSFNDSQINVFSNYLDNANNPNLSEFKGSFEVTGPETTLQIIFNIHSNESSVKRQFEFYENDNISVSEDNLVFSFRLIPVNYPVIFDTNSIKSGTSIVFSHAFSNDKPFTQYKNNNNKIRVECSKITPSHKYGVFKLQFELDLEKFNMIDASEINALIMMNNLRPYCSNTKIDDDTYVIKISKSFLNSNFDNKQKILYYPIPFVIKDDDSKTPFIEIIDIFLSPLNYDVRCNFDVPMFNESFSFIHNACIAKDDDIDKIKSLTYYSNGSDISITQYTYPPNNLVKNWKLLGFSLIPFINSSCNISYPIIISQKKIEILNNETYVVKKNISGDYLVTCMRCKSIRVVVEDYYTKQYSNYYINNEKNHTYLVPTYFNKDYYFYAVCKNESGRYCEKTLTGLDDQKLSLISIPQPKSFICENKYTQNNNLDFLNYVQFVYDQNNVTYLTYDMRSSIQNIFTFNYDLEIKISARFVGNFIRISAIEINSGITIPFSFAFNSNLYDIFKIKNKEIPLYQIAGNIFTSGNVEFEGTPNFHVSKAETLFNLPIKMHTKLKRIDVCYNLGQKKSYDDNKFSFYQKNYNENDYFPLKYPEINQFYFFVNKSNNKVIINVQDDLDYLYLNLTSEDILSYNTTITFKCTTIKKIKGEILIRSGITIIFNGTFNLTELFITTIVDWKNNSAGLLSFINVLYTPQIDVDCKKGNGNNNQNVTLILSGNPTLNLLTKYDPINNNEYFVDEKSIYCVSSNKNFINNDEFCIYKKNRASCFYLNNEMECISEDNLKQFSSYSKEITLYIAENVTFSEETLQSFFDHTNNILTLKILSDKANVAINGTIKCPMNVILSFDDNNDKKLYINDLKIQKSISFIQIYDSKKIGIIDLMYKNVKSVEVYIDFDEVPFKFQNSFNRQLIINCNKQNVSIINNVHFTKYLNISIDDDFHNGKHFINVSSEIIFDFSNVYYFYENDTENYHNLYYDKYLFQNKDISKISNYIDTSKENLTLCFLQNGNIDLDLFAFKKIKNVYINGTEKINLSGNIKIPEGTKAYISNLIIDNLILDIDINISNEKSSFYDIIQCSGNPSIKIYPHLLPKNINECENKEIEVLKRNSKFNIKIPNFEFPMNGGYIKQSAKIVTKSSQLFYLIVIYNFTRLEFDSNQSNHACLYQTNSSLCPIDSKKISYIDFCSTKFDNTASNHFIFYLVENLTHPSCNLNLSLWNVTLFGDHYIKGNMSLKGKIHLDILNPKIINELQIEIFAEMDDKEIKVPSIFTFEEAEPKSLKVNITNYLPEVEYNFPESNQFLKGLCMNTTYDVPYPRNRDFRIRPICSNVDGIYGMKITSLIQNYNPNHFCVYETSIDKCIFNNNLENYQPIKYSEILPLFEKDKSKPSLFFFDSPNDHYYLSFQYASMNNYDTATIVNNDNAKLTIFVPSNFDIYANGHYSKSVFYYQLDFNAEENVFNNYGSLYFKEIENWTIYPIPLNHNNIVFKEKINLNGYNDDFLLNANQNHYKLCSINYNQTINMKYSLNQYDTFSFDKIYDVFLSKYKIIRLSNSEKLQLNGLNDNKYIIQSTIGNTITFDMSEKYKNSDKSQIFFFIKEVRINFTEVKDIDFKNYNIFFYKCILDDQWIDKIKGNNLLFDSESFNSFYRKPNKLKLFNGDKIEISKNNISLRNNKYQIKKIELIELNLYNTFYDNIGEEIKFIGNVSTLSIGCVQNKTHLQFINFSKLTIISEKINKFIPISNVTNFIIQSDSKNEKNYINSIEVFENYQTEIKSNGKTIVENLILNCNYDAFSIYRIGKIEICEAKNISLKNGVIIDSIVINNNSSLTLDSCNSESEKIKVYIHNILNSPQLIHAILNLKKFGK